MIAGPWRRLFAVLGLGGAVALAGGLGLYAWYGVPLPVRGAAEGGGAMPAVPAPPASAPSLSAAGQAAPRAAAAAAPASHGAASPAPAQREQEEPPRFDVVRIGARGSAVVAGRANSGDEVLLFEGDRELGRARADARGEWVILPESPLAPGTRELRLVARRPGGAEMAGADTVVVLVPEPQASSALAAMGTPAAPAAPREATTDTAAAAPASPSPVAPQAPASPLVVLIPPADSDAMPRVLQAPSEAVAALRPSAPPSSAAAAPPETGEVADRAEGQAPAGPSPASVGVPPPRIAGPLLAERPADAQGRLGLDIVDYDDAGTMRFAGTAAPGATVRVYVGEAHAGDAVADAQGRWHLVPRETPAVGRHTLRLDQLAASGAVAARIELPFQRDDVTGGALADGRVVVQPGHSLWRIARQVYGRGLRYTVIYEANRDQIRNPDLIYPGQVFALPSAAEASAAAPGTTAAAPAPAASTPADSSRSR